jgi:hypothetical protein
MSDYSQGKIYILKSKNTEDVYIGSTKYTLEERFHTHMVNYYKWLRKKGYCSSIEIIKHGEPYIELLELYPCNTKKELRLKEGEYQRMIDSVNIRIEGRTKKEWVEDNKEHIKEQSKEYHSRPEVKKRTNERYKKYYEDNKEKILEKCKQHRKDNPELYKKRHKKNYQKHKDKIIKRNSENYEKRKNVKYICVCGKEIRIDNKRRHERSKKHIQYIEDMKEKGDLTNINEFIEHITTN